MKKLIAGLAAVATAAFVAPAPTNAQEAADLTLLHGIPGVTVDVAAGGAVLIPGFEPGDTQDLSSFAGQTLSDVEVRLAGTEDIAIGPVEALELPAAGSFTIIAHLDAEGTPTISTFENNSAPTAEGQGRLTVRHTAAAPAVDLVVGEDRPIENAANGASADLELPAGEIAGAQLAPTGADPIIDVPTVELAAGSNLIVYAVGSLADDTFTFFTQEIEVGVEGVEQGSDGTPAPTEVNTGDAISSSTNVMAFAIAAFALFVLAGGLAAARRKVTV